MRIAIEGCAHGELEKIYFTIAEIERQENYKVDLLLCCGDFQATRNPDDLNCMAVPKKFQSMCSFYKYYSGEKLAPILTIFIGGNHEASNYLQELPYGGWVAPNIYYLGYAGVVQVNGLRIGGVSGIYKGFDYNKGHFEISPYDDHTKRSVYHLRQLEVFRLKQLSSNIDIMMSHDWPRGVYNYGNKEQLCRFKPHFTDEVAANKLGSPPLEKLLAHMRPTYWFSAHLHCKFAAIIPHTDPVGSTRFLALDKCLPQRRFLQIIDFPAASGPVTLSYDLEWLAILCITKHLIEVKPTMHYMPGPDSPYRYDFTPTDDEKALVLEKMAHNLAVPSNFVRTAEPYNPQQRKNGHTKQPNAQLNAQTTTLCERLGIDDPISLVMLSTGMQLNHSTYRDQTAELDDSNASHNDSAATTNSSFNTSAEGATSTLKKQRSAFTLPAPLNDSSENADCLTTLDGGDATTENPDRVDIDDDFEPTSMNSTLSTSFTLVRPNESLDEPNTSLSDMATMLTSAVNIESPKSEASERVANASQPVDELNKEIECETHDCAVKHEDTPTEDNELMKHEDTSTEENDLKRGVMPMQTNITEFGEGLTKIEDVSPPKKFKRRNQAIYAETDELN